MLRCSNHFSLSIPVLAALCALSSHARAVVDVDTTLDANTLGLRVSNLGWAGYDPTTSEPGLEFPRGSGRYALFAGGLWLGAKVEGTTRIALVDYETEFVPGPMASGTFLPDLPVFHVYKLRVADTTGTGDWMANAVPQGAPTSAFGTRPGFLGSRTTWSVCNDADPARHTSRAGGTASLGVEVRQTAWASADNTLDDHVIFLRWQVRNAGAAVLDSMLIGLWADPDLGSAVDDLVGSDPALDMGYVYNATNLDFIYGSNPPALAYVLMQGPRVSPASEPMHSLAINAYIGGDDPQGGEETYRLLLGLRRDASPWIDPGTGLPSRFAYTGDPVTGTGWLDPDPTDQRFLISCGPFTLAPGDSQEVVMAIVAAQAANRLQSITLLRSYVASLRQSVGVPSLPPVIDPGLSLAPLPSPAIGPVRARLVAPLGAAWRLEAFDVRGRRVALVALGTGTGAAESVSWDPARCAGAPGVYWVVASAGSERVSQRVVVLAR